MHISVPGLLPSRLQVIITRDPHGRAGDSMSLFNADVILIRRQGQRNVNETSLEDACARSPWSSQFLQRWWDDARMKEGRTDQEVLELLYVEAACRGSVCGRVTSWLCARAVCWHCACAYWQCFPAGYNSAHCCFVSVQIT